MERWPWYVLAYARTTGQAPCLKHFSCLIVYFGCNIFSYGEVAEWLNAQHSKRCVPQGIEGSNPFLSSILRASRFGWHGQPTPETSSGFGPAQPDYVFFALSK